MGRDRNSIGAGIVLITVGLIFLADRQGYGGFGSFWPLILIAMGASKFFSSGDDMFSRSDRRCRRGDTRYGGIWLIMVGVIFLLHQNHIWRISQTWPLFIVAGGVGIILSGVLNRRDNNSNTGDPTIGGGGQAQ